MTRVLPGAARTVKRPVRPKLTARAKRGLVLLAEGNGGVNATERDDIAAARAWIAWGVEFGGWTRKRKRRPSWRQSVVANTDLADKRGYS